MIDAARVDGQALSIGADVHDVRGAGGDTFCRELAADRRRVDSLGTTLRVGIVGNVETRAEANLQYLAGKTSCYAFANPSEVATTKRDVV